MAQTRLAPAQLLLRCFPETTSPPPEIAPNGENKRRCTELLEALNKHGYSSILDALPAYDTVQMCQTQTLLIPMFKIGTVTGKAVRSLTRHGLLIVTGVKPGRLHSRPELLIEREDPRDIELIPPFCWLGSVTVDNNYIVEESLALAQYYLLRWAALRAGDPEMLAMEMPDYETLRSALNIINRYEHRPEFGFGPGQRAVVHFENMRIMETARSKHGSVNPIKQAHLGVGLGRAQVSRPPEQVAAVGRGT
jgi:hypothetical protein